MHTHTLVLQTTHTKGHTNTDSFPQHTHIHINTRKHTHIRAYTHINPNMNTYTRTHTYKNIHTHRDTYIHTTQKLVLIVEVLLILYNLKSYMALLMLWFIPQSDSEDEIPLAAVRGIRDLVNFVRRRSAEAKASSVSASTQSKDSSDAQSAYDEVKLGIHHSINPNQ